MTLLDGSNQLSLFGDGPVHIIINRSKGGFKSLQDKFFFADGCCQNFKDSWMYGEGKIGTWMVGEIKVLSKSCMLAYRGVPPMTISWMGIDQCPWCDGQLLVLTTDQYEVYRATVDLTDRLALVPASELRERLATFAA